MFQRVGALGLALIGALLINASSASPAQAVVPELHCTSTTVTCIVQGTGTDHKFTFGIAEAPATELTFGCSGPEVKTTTWTTSTTIVLEPLVYSGCTIKGSKNKPTVNMNGCRYVLHLVKEGESPYPFEMDLICPIPGKNVTITFSELECTITLGPQTNIAGGTMANSGGEPKDVQVTFAVTSAIYSLAGTKCFSPPGMYTNGRYSGTLTLQGYNDLGGEPGPKVGLHVF